MSLKVNVNLVPYKHFLKIKSYISIGILSVITVVSFSFCGGKSKSENSFEEGVIEYKTDVINSEHPLASFAPTTATAKLKANKWIIEMSTMGLFNVYFSCDLDKGTLTEMIKYMDIKNACIENDSTLKEENDKYQLTFKETSDTKVIAGFKCKKVIATKVLDPKCSFDVYYTEDIGPENENSLTPYKSLKGMLMDYRIMRLGLEMHFVATSAKKEEVKDAEFEIPSFFKILTRKEFDDEFNKLFADFF